MTLVYKLFITNNFMKKANIKLVHRSVACLCADLEECRAPDKNAYWKSTFFISHPKHMLWVLKRTFSMRRFF